MASSPAARPTAARPAAARPAAARRRLGAFRRLALAMAALGLLVGLVFPAFTLLLGVPPESTHTPTFRLACLGAGLALALANLVLARRVVGRRLAVLAAALQDVSRTVGERGGTDGDGRSRWAALAPDVCADADLGPTADAFSALLTALEREEHFRAAVRGTGDATVLVSADGTVTFASDAVRALTGWPPSAAVGRQLVRLVHPDDATALAGLLGGPEAGRPARCVVRVRHRRRGGEDGWVHLEVSASGGGPGQGEERGQEEVLVGRDVTERLRLERRLEHQAHHDHLTGLPNRAALLTRGGALLAQAPERPLAVLLCDLDRFKEVNDTLGHDYGDRLLQQVGPRLRGALGEDDVLARLGGDEFAVLLPGASPQEAHATGVRLREALAAAFPVDGLALDVDASIGVSHVDRAPDGLTPEEAVGALLRSADVAMYAAKERASGVEPYRRDADVHDRSRLVLLSDFRRALASEQLLLHYQPQVRVRDGRLVGLEALVRWQHPVRGLLAPAEFLPLVETTGLVEQLTDVVLDLALAQVRRWVEAGTPVPVAVTLSARSVHRADLPGRVTAALARHGVDAGLLRLEITESALVLDPGRAREVLDRLAGAGVRLSLDDVGTGYASVLSLTRLPVDELKVDRSLVSTMTTREEDAALVRSAVALGHDLGLRVVAEGVDGAETLLALERLGCDVAQGLHCGRPAAARDVTDLLRAAPPSRARADVGLPASAGPAQQPTSLLAR
ncbi:EAL domain-containing protein [Pseudokineococcus basanitobsidens]|uniref:EAL domain-containing protein n=1 Tax=Pseudokineococcus basanitobsidens TaxID=1926649 RepID=A0ABU8RL35_9ACTN